MTDDQDNQDDQQAIWLNKIMKRLLPDLIYNRAQQTSTERFAAKWMARHKISIAIQGEEIAVLREGKVYASWKPGQ